jgi:hypothetical protein
MILRYALTLVLNFQFHQIEKILKFELNDVKPVAVLNFRRIIIIVVEEDIIRWLLVDHRASRMVGFRLVCCIRNALVAKINAMIEAI